MFIQKLKSDLRNNPMRIFTCNSCVIQNQWGKEDIQTMDRSLFFLHILNKNIS